MNMCMYK